MTLRNLNQIELGGGDGCASDDGAFGVSSGNDDNLVATQRWRSLPDDQAKGELYTNEGANGRHGHSSGTCRCGRNYGL